MRVLDEAVQGVELLLGEDGDDWSVYVGDVEEGEAQVVGQDEPGDGQVGQLGEREVLVAEDDDELLGVVGDEVVGDVLGGRVQGEAADAAQSVDDVVGFVVGGGEHEYGLSFDVLNAETFREKQNRILNRGTSESPVGRSIRAAPQFSKIVVLKKLVAWSQQ